MLSSVKAVTTPVGVLVSLLSRMRTEPTVWLEGEVDMFSPVWQLLICRDLKVQAQFQFTNTAVLQSLNVKLRVVNCWLPRNIP